MSGQTHKYVRAVREVVRLRCIVHTVHWQKICVQRDPFRDLEAFESNSFDVRVYGSDRLPITLFVLTTLPDYHDGIRAQYTQTNPRGEDRTLHLFFGPVETKNSRRFFRIYVFSITRKKSILLLLKTCSHGAPNRQFRYRRALLVPSVVYRYNIKDIQRPRFLQNGWETFTLSRQMTNGPDAQSVSKRTNGKNVSSDVCFVMFRSFHANPPQQRHRVQDSARFSCSYYPSSNYTNDYTRSVSNVPIVFGFSFVRRHDRRQMRAIRRTGNLSLASALTMDSSACDGDHAV